MQLGPLLSLRFNAGYILLLRVAIVARSFPNSRFRGNYLRNAFFASFIAKSFARGRSYALLDRAISQLPGHISL